MSSTLDPSIRDSEVSGLSIGSRLSFSFRGSGIKKTPQPADPLSNSGRSQTSTERRPERRISFLRKLFESRNNDYHADDQVVGEPSHRIRMTRSVVRTIAATATGGRSSPPPEMLDEEKSSLFSCLRPSQPVLDLMSRIIESRLWRLIIILNTILLLFGSEVQELWIPPQGDTVMDVFFTLALAVFSFDIILRCFLEPTYMPWCGCAESKCILGSFMWWCDVVSTLTLLQNISFVNKKLLQMITFDIELNELGIPVTGLDDVNSSLPVETEVEVLILIARAARVARFIRKWTVVKSRSFSSIDWFTQKINPFGYIQACRQKRRSSLALSSEGGTELGSDHPASYPSQNKHKIVRSSSWGGLQMAVMAKTRTGPKEVLDKSRGIKGLGVWALKSIGLYHDDSEEVRQQIAATKIQRSWRARGLANNNDLSQHDVAWVGQRGAAASGEPKQPGLQGAPAGTRASIAKSVKNKIKASTLAPTRNRRPESQVGSAMRELTGQRVALGIIISLVLTMLFTYKEYNATRPSAMIMLHNQTANEQFADTALRAARLSSIPDLYEYLFANGEVRMFPIPEVDIKDLRARQILRISITGDSGNSTVGFFANKNEMASQAWMQICVTIFILLVWFFGVTAFAGPVMTLVVIPIERMVRLLGMLMMDPLGYQSTSRYKKFVAEEDELTKHTRWTKEVLKGMETSFLMSTILRIGSLMKVGFGSAGVEIIRNNLETGQSKNMLILNSQGSTVSCIFLFCDIRQFTDATECLQEEVFVFTNRIAGVVHSICHSYGGSANKNIGDAFLLSWLLDDGPATNQSSGDIIDYDDPSHASAEDFLAKHSQADKALLSVVKISIALHHDNYYLEPLSEVASEALLAKVSKRKGPVVQLGFGLHAGKAVQGAIGSQRKIDATYVSEAVERSEFLESSTKKYGVKMLMSDSFHRLLHPSNRRRCRKIDQISLQTEDYAEYQDIDQGDIMDLFTFDMDIDALWRPPPKPATMTPATGAADDNASETGSQNEQKGSRRDILRAQSVRGPGVLLKVPALHRRRSIGRVKSGGNKDDSSSEEFKSVELTTTEAAIAAVAAVVTGAPNQMPVNNPSNRDATEEAVFTPPELVLPTGPALYNANVWLSEDMRNIRQLYSDGLFFQKFNSGFLSYYARDWEHAKQCFQTILERFDDGPSTYFLKKINETDGVPPHDFKGYGSS